MEESSCALFMNHLKKTLHMSICANTKAPYFPVKLVQGLEHKTSEEQLRQ